MTSNFSEVYLLMVEADDRSSWLRMDRMLSVQLELDAGAALRPAWDPKERGPDPMAWRIRRLLEFLTEPQRDVVEDYYFAGKSRDEISVERGCSPAAVTQMLRRAEAALVKAIALHGQEVTTVPMEEM